MISPLYLWLYQETDREHKGMRFIFKTFDNGNLNVSFPSMVFARSEQAKQARALRKRREAVATKIAFVLAAPCLFVYFTNYQEPTMAWLYEQGLLPKYGIMQFIEGRQVIDWDRVMVSGIAGALFTTVGYVIALPIVRRIVK